GGRIDDPHRPATTAPDLPGPDIQAATPLADERGGLSRRHGLKVSATGRCRARGPGLATKTRGVLSRGCQFCTLPHTAPCPPGLWLCLPDCLEFCLDGCPLFRRPLDLRPAEPFLRRSHVPSPGAHQHPPPCDRSLPPRPSA